MKVGTPVLQPRSSLPRAAGRRLRATAGSNPHHFFREGRAATGFSGGGGAVAVTVPPSSSERLSSTSTVCVRASVPVAEGSAAAGATVSVVCEGALAGSRPPQARTRARAATTMSDWTAVLFKQTSLAPDAMQRP